MSDTIIVVVKETETVIVSAPGPQGIPGPGVPMGGVFDQGLIKNSATHFDTGWGIPGLNTVSAWNVQQYYPVAELSVNGDNSIDWDWDYASEAKISVARSDSYVLNAPTNRQPGIKTLRVYQDTDGDGVLSFDGAYLLDSSLSEFTYAGNSFVDLFCKDDGTYLTLFYREYIL